MLKKQLRYSSIFCSSSKVFSINEFRLLWNFWSITVSLVSIVLFYQIFRFLNCFMNFNFTVFCNVYHTVYLENLWIFILIDLFSQTFFEKAVLFTFPIITKLFKVTVSLYSILSRPDFLQSMIKQEYFDLFERGK